MYTSVKSTKNKNSNIYKIFVSIPNLTTKNSPYNIIVFLQRYNFQSVDS